MARDKRGDVARTSAPDLEILGDQVTLHPSGYIEPPERSEAGKEEALMENTARFRTSPLEVLSTQPELTVDACRADSFTTSSFGKSPSMFLAPAGAPIMTSLASPSSIRASARI